MLPDDDDDDDDGGDGDDDDDAMIHLLCSGIICHNAMATAFTATP